MAPTLRNNIQIQNATDADRESSADGNDHQAQDGNNADDLTDLDSQDRAPTPTAATMSPDILTTLDQATLIALIKTLVKSNDGPVPKGTDVRHPDKFDGVDRSKLRTYLAQCMLVFRANPRKFDTDTKKVTYACSYLDGLAFDWYENIIDSEIEPDWFHNWSIFRTTLDYHFGEINPSHAAERKIRTLIMKDSESVITYITKFRTYSGRLNWNDSAITAEFRRGLSSRIKDDLAKVDYEDLSFTGLEQLVIKIDSRQQERRMERDLESRTKPADDKAKPRDDRKNNRRNDRNDRHRDSSDPDASRASKPSSGSTRPASDGHNLPLDNQGKVREDEKARRKRLGLCDYCGSNQHKIDDCDVKPKNNLRASTTTFSVEGFQ